MKHIFSAAAAALLALSLSNSAFAHSHLGESNPANGDVVTEPLNEIVIEFDGQIEQGSFIDVTTTSGQTVELQEIIIGEGTLTGTVAEPLPNNEYQVNWSIISADGHPLDGEFSFTVNAPDPETVEEVTEEPSETTKAIEETNGKTEQSTEIKEVVSADEEGESSSTTVILIVLLVIVAVSGFFFLTKRKK
ncbi:copper resistance CopC family protein [Solibacillus sp. FSL H8-0538]|uniref:copper resistance CopC family protein n=1 Tax=Solibacillus sp. FSL H8-0538 TaxID=2921400 RepID=UPI0030FB0A68